MITCDKSHLIGRCNQRGYTLEEVMPCVIAQSGDEWTIDPDHPAYPKEPKPGYEPLSLPEPVAGGAGTELKALLSKIGITSQPDCQCNARARHMNEQGIEWCEQHIDEIVGWLREEAGKRGLPFVDIAGRLLVKKAISNARRNGQ